MNDIADNSSEEATWSLFADDTGILTTGRTLQVCEDKMQPALDVAWAWARRWKVGMSSNKCCFTVFTIDPAEMGGKVQPTLTLGPDALAYEQYPTFLGITLDGADLHAPRR